MVSCRDIRVRGFWVTGGSMADSPAEFGQLVDRLVGMVQQGTLHVDAAEYPFANWRDALAAATGDRRARKVLLTMS